MSTLFEIEKEMRDSLKKEYPEFVPGDIIKVFYKIKEKDKERLHPIEGIVIKAQGEMQRKTFTLRRISYGEAFEVTFPFYTPLIDKIEMVKRSKRKARRKRLYYLRDRVGKKAMAT